MLSGNDLMLSSTISAAASSAVVSNNTFSAALSGNSQSQAQGTTVTTLVDPVHELKVFEYGELEVLTKNFAHQISDCWEGVYRGWLDGKKSEIAVHLLGLPSGSSQLPSLIMVAKIQLFGSLSHPNLIPLLGYCLNHSEMLLVYEFSESYTSLEYHLFNSPLDTRDKKKDALPPLSWDKRLKIAVEAARGLDFLHLMDVVFLRYFQASSILLDKSFGVKIAGFNFLITDSEANQKTAKENVADFEDMKAAEHQRQQDVYDFGVVLLELLTGLPLGRSRQQPQYSVRVEWIKQRILSRDGIYILMDSRLKVSRDAAFPVARVALCCLELNPLHRPHIGQVLQTLNRIKELQESSQFCTNS
ncbi:hypothetical protein CDL15_Pgr007587 [Punica granatum]|uniref:Protein kinase domain-containing protein n=1 Tax=Punica granatum TaxID=22663 RepID=A0A218XA27_PUNGR|nr:hypothetical protein CDL15_Pgr007587 [Punica granatum]